MGKGDQRSKRGKIAIGSFGRLRPRKKATTKQLQQRKQLQKKQQRKRLLKKQLKRNQPVSLLQRL